MTFTVPAAFAAGILAREGAAGQQWLAALPNQVRALCARWKLTIEGPPWHGGMGIVIPVRQGDALCALKLAWQDASTQDEAAALAAWQGRGAAQLLAVDPAAGALLLERLDGQRTLRAVDLAQALSVAGRLLRRLAVPAPPGFRRLAAVAAELEDLLPLLWQHYGHRLPRHALDHACALANQLGPAAGNLLVNYDLHYDNVLAGVREPWLAVDPKVVAGDLEYGIAQLLWCRLEEIEAQGGLGWHFDALVEAAAVDLALARSWTLVRCVDYWLWGLSVGLTADPARCARIVEWLMGIGAPRWRPAMPACAAPGRP